MTEPVKRRRYRSDLRAKQALATRRAVLRAARDLFVAKGYERSAISDVADRAGVSVDTVYASVGRKPQLLLAVVDMRLGGLDIPVPAEERDYVRGIRDAVSAEEKIAVYAAALGTLMPHVTPLLEALRRAAETDSECAGVWLQVNERRATNMRLFAADLRSTGRVRLDLSDDEVADIVWSTNSVQYFSLLTSRGWSPQRYADLLTQMWTRLLLS